MTTMQRLCVVLLVATVAVDAARLHQPAASANVDAQSPCSGGCPVFTQPTFYVSTKAPVTADQVSATQQWWSMVAQLPQVPSAPVYTAFASTFALARNVSQPFLAQALPSALGAQASILNATVTCYSAVNKTGPALISMWKSAKPSGQAAILSQLESLLTMTVHRLNTSVAAARGAVDVLNGLRDSSVEPTVLAAAGVIQACGNTHLRITAYQLQQLYDRDNVTACGSNATCVATWTAKLNATDAKIAFQQDLARVCNTTVGDFAVDVDQNAEALAIDIYEDFASSLQFQVGTLSNGVSNLALALQQIKQDNGPNFFTGALLQTASEACGPAGSAAYHFGVSACPALCPPSTRGA